MGIDVGAIRFTFPAAVALDPKGFAGAIENIAEKLGCGKCFSGVDCLFQRQRSFTIEESKALPVDPIPIMPLSTVDVAMPGKISSDIHRLRKAADIVFGKLGCLPCTSGFDVLFRNTLRTLTINEDFKVQEFGRGF